MTIWPSHNNLLDFLILKYLWWHLLLIRLRTSLDVKRTESLKGITVFRGQIPGSCSSKVKGIELTESIFNIFYRKLWNLIYKFLNDGWKSGYKIQKQKSIFIPLCLRSRVSIEIWCILYDPLACSYQKTRTLMYIKTKNNKESIYVTTFNVHRHIAPGDHYEASEMGMGDWYSYHYCIILHSLLTWT